MISFNSYKGTIVINYLKNLTKGVQASIPIKEQLLFRITHNLTQREIASIPIKEQLLFNRVKEIGKEILLQFL